MMLYPKPNQGFDRFHEGSTRAAHTNSDGTSTRRISHSEPRLQYPPAISCVASLVSGSHSKAIADDVARAGGAHLVA